MTFVHLNQEQVEYKRNLVCFLVLVLCDEMFMQSLDLRQQITEDHDMEQSLGLNIIMATLHHIFRCITKRTMTW
jgi:hypothetical protein